MAAPRGASALGVVALGRGLPRSATRYFRITVASLNEFDGLWLRYNLTFLARAAALAGLVDEARGAEPVAGGAATRVLPGRLGDRGSGRHGRRRGYRCCRRACAPPRHAGAASIGQWGASLMAAHDAARYTGSSEAAELATLAADRANGALGPIVADHARARAVGDATLLAEVSERFEGLGWMLHACEAAYAATHAYRSGFAARTGAAAAIRATTLHARCERTFIPWVSAFDTAQALTGANTTWRSWLRRATPTRRSPPTCRSRCAPSRTTCSRAYTKLGITSRLDLPAVLAVGAGYEFRRRQQHDDDHVTASAGRVAVTHLATAQLRDPHAGRARRRPYVVVH